MSPNKSEPSTCPGSAHGVSGVLGSCQLTSVEAPATQGLWGDDGCWGGCVVSGQHSSGSHLQGNRGRADRWRQRQGHEPGPEAWLLPQVTSMKWGSS